MKKAILLGTIILCGAVGAKAQVADGRIKIDKVRIVEQDEQVTVNFQAQADHKAAVRNHTLVFRPVLTDGQYKVSMPSIIVQGKGSQKSQSRSAWVSGVTANDQQARYLSNGQTVDYTATIPSQEWMDGARLEIEGAEGGCCRYNPLANELLAEAINLNRIIPEPVLVEAPVPVAEWAPVTVADNLSTTFTFVVPESEYDPSDPFKIYDDERENALIVYYRQGKYLIESGYMDNERTLSNLSTAINMILNSTDSKVNRIIVGGFSSPEGSREVNHRFAHQRAVSVKKYIMETTSAHDNQIEVFNGEADWRGLRALISKSNLAEKDQIIHIIDHTPVWDSQRNLGRLGELMRMNGGRTYRVLLHEYFPLLRNGAFIKVYYENLDDQVQQTIISTQ